MVGEDAKTPSRSAKKNPKEAKLKRGSSETRLKPSRLTTDPRGEQGPVGERLLLAHLGNRMQATSANDMRAPAGDELVQLRVGGTP